MEESETRALLTMLGTSIGNYSMIMVLRQLVEVEQMSEQDADATKNALVEMTGILHRLVGGSLDDMMETFIPAIFTAQQDQITRFKTYLDEMKKRAGDGQQPEAS